LEPAVPYQLPREVVLATLLASRGSWLQRLRRRLRGKPMTPATVEASLMLCLDDALRRVYHDVHFLADGSPELRAAARVQAHAVRTVAGRISSQFGLPETEGARLATAVIGHYAAQAAQAAVRTGPITVRISDGLWTFATGRGGQGPGRR
jgi:hypothetical protein